MTPDTILVIDDDSLVRWSLTQLLSQKGYRVLDAGTAADARAQARTSPAPRLIVLDLKLPDMDGLALLEVLRREGITCPVIVLSAHLTPELSLRALAAGASYVAEKPFQLDVLHALVRRALGPPHPSPI
jgi:DNA-binding response OmpR family regulator